MVLTRSRAASPASAGGSSFDAAARPSALAPDSAPRSADAGADAAHSASTYLQPEVAAAAAPVVMTTDQLLLLIDRLSRSDPVNTPVPTCSGNFAKCTARFDGEKSSNVEAFIDAVETYKECVRVDDHNALRGLTMLLTGMAATWWQGVKDTTLTWQSAIDALKQTFGPRLPPHRLYRNIFEREQRADESTDLFVCRIRALFAQLPPQLLTETVQLDMTYGLLHRRLREKVPRTSFDNFSGLLTEARRVEDLFDEVKPRAAVDTKPVLPSSGSVPRIPTAPAAHTAPTAPAAVPTTQRSRPLCYYCKQYGHLKENCQRLTKPKRDNPAEGETRASSITCFGCGAPGVIRSNCPTCKEKKPVVSAVTSFQSVSASSDNIDSRVRPVLSVEIYGEVGSVLIDTGAKHCIGSVSLRTLLVKYGHEFHNVYTELKYADGRSCAQNVDVAHVNVKVRGVALVVSFIMLPDATESLLGMNFIQDVGMVLDFDRGEWFVRHDRSPQSIRFESRPLQHLTCSSVGLREDEGTHLGTEERDQLSELLNVNEDIFTPGGEPTTFAVHRIDTGDAAPIASPPYRVTPAKKEIIRKEIDKMLEAEIIAEAESQWASPVVLVPKKNARDIEPYPTKVEAVLSMRPPTNLKELKTFLQTCSWFRKFIPQFLEVARLLTDLTKKDRRWSWGEDEQRAFEELKLRLSTSPILQQTNFEEPFVLRTDAQNMEFARVLQDVKQRVLDQQDVRKSTGNQHRRDILQYEKGDLVLVDTHMMSNASKGFTRKFAPRREGPYRISQIVSPTSFIVEDCEGVCKGKYHASALTPYAGTSTAISHQRRRGRPAKSQSSRPCDLEGEDIARTIARGTPCTPPSTPRRSPRLATAKTCVGLPSSSQK